MPRPPMKRRRQNSYGIKQRVNVQVPDQSQAKQALEQKLSHKLVGKRPTDSDDSDELVTTRASGRNRKRQEIYASGAVAKGDKPGAYPTKIQRTRSMREDTQEILSQRSMSASRASSVASISSIPAPQPSTDKQNEPKQPKMNPGRLSSTKKRNNKDAVPPMINGTSHTPQADVSVLGRIKPRKRQASILQLIENDGNNDSSILNSEDEEQFLPDDISTPLKQRTQNVASAPAEELTSNKRKRGSELPRMADSTHFMSTIPPNTSQKHSPPAPHLPHLSRSQERKLDRTPKQPREIDDQVMAPPESSDDDDALIRPQNRGVSPANRKKHRNLVPSTLQLQELMPSMKHKPIVRTKRHDEFDLPDDAEDNSGEDQEDENEHSAFLPGRPRKAPKIPQARAKGVRQKVSTKPARPKTKVKDNSKSTRNTSYRPSSARLRTPLPLSSTISGNAEAKSPSKQDTVMRDKTSNTPGPTLKVGQDAKQQYGGSRSRGAGKENQPTSLSNNHLDLPSTEVRAWNKRWAEIDDFSLDFEENTASTRSSSPTAR